MTPDTSTPDQIADNDFHYGIIVHHTHHIAVSSQLSRLLSQEQIFQICESFLVSAHQKVHLIFIDDSLYHAGVGFRKDSLDINSPLMKFLFVRQDFTLDLDL